MLNTFWGKFGQNANVTKTKYFDAPEPFLKMVYDLTKIIKAVRFYGERLASVNYASETDFVDVLPNTSVVIAAYTTAQARLKLYTYLEKLQERALYMDTGKYSKIIMNLNVSVHYMYCVGRIRYLPLNNAL